MAFTIQNRARHLLVLPLNSGGTLHLAPGETSSPIEDFELDKNERVERLLADGLITTTKSAAVAGGGDEDAVAEGAQAETSERRRGGHRN